MKTQKRDHRGTAAMLLGAAVWLARRGPLPLRLAGVAAVLLRWYRRRRRLANGSGADPRAADYADRDRITDDVEEAPHDTAGGRRHRADR
jgi:hypothetical protein